MSIEISASEAVPGYLEKFIGFFSSIRHVAALQDHCSRFFTVIILLAAMNAILALEVMRFNRKYDAIITNITTANSINGYIKPAIDTEMWDIVAGKNEFKDGNQYQIIDQVNSADRIDDGQRQLG